MKKILLYPFFVLLLSVCLFPLTASADILVEVENDFYREHRSQCIRYYQLTYTANAPEGYIYLYESPDPLAVKTEVLPNGATVSGCWYYTDESGETWCIILSGEYTPSGDEEVRGWLRLSDCIQIRNCFSFWQMHFSEFTDYDEAYDHAFDGIDSVALWDYPCSGIRASFLDADPLRTCDFLPQLFQTCWRDPQGRLWGYIYEYYGARNRWVCLDDPSSTDIPADESVLPPDTVIYPPADKLPRLKNGISTLTIVLVLAVAAVTVVLLYVFFVKGKKRSRSDRSA